MGAAPSLLRGRQQAPSLNSKYQQRLEDIGLENVLLSSLLALHLYMLLEDLKLWNSKMKKDMNKRALLLWRILMLLLPLNLLIPISLKAAESPISRYIL